MSALVIHNTHELHQLKKALLRLNMVMTVKRQLSWQRMNLMQRT